MACYIERGDPNFVLEAPDEPLVTTIGRVPTIQEEVELGGLKLILDGAMFTTFV